MDNQGKKRGRKSITDFLVHIHPPTLPEETLRFSLSWGLGGMSATLVFLLFATGILQLLTYEPSIDGAYESVRAMYSQVPFGGWIRNIHHWSANLLVIVVSLHLLRVFLTGAIGPGRRLNWIIGLVLFDLVLFANFSGYLLPWDQLAYWAVTICTSMMAYLPGIGPWLSEIFRGGTVVGQSTLANFYGLHIAGIPGAFVLLMVWHFWLVRRSGGLVRLQRDEGPAERVPTVPNLIVREAAVGLSLIAVVLIVSIFWNAPLQELANPGMSPNPAKAPWYFLGFQELLLHMHPVFAICVVPVIISGLLLFLPFWPGAVLPGGEWFGGGKRGKILAIWTYVAGSLFTVLLVILDEKLLRSVGSKTGTADVFTRGYFPLICFTAGSVAGYLLLVRQYRFSRGEAVMAGMVLGWAVLVALTVIGIWFRGPGMQLIWFGG